MQHPPISRTRYVQEDRKMRFQEVYERWSQGQLTQAEGALLLGRCERSFRRHIERFEADGMDGLLGVWAAEGIVRIGRQERLSFNTAHECKLHRLLPRATTTFA